MCSPSIDLSYFYPQKYAITYIHHIHYVLLLSSKVCNHLHPPHSLCATSVPGSTTHIYALHFVLFLSWKHVPMMLLPWEYAFIHPHSTSTQKMFYSYTGRRHPKIFIMSYSTYLVKLRLFQLILPIVISALKGLGDLKEREKEKKKDREKKIKRTKGPKRKER